MIMINVKGQDRVKEHYIPIRLTRIRVGNPDLTFKLDTETRIDLFRMILLSGATKNQLWEDLHPPSFWRGL